MNPSTTFVRKLPNSRATPVYLVDMAHMVEGTPRHFLNVGQAAEYLGVSAASLRNWSDQGKVPVYRTPGGQRRYRVTDLDKFIESWRETPLSHAE
jgi:excisionase family DNA binding protein